MALRTLVLKSYLLNQKQYVDFFNNRSAYARFCGGVPQGSILRPLLFIIYVNDITASSNIFKCIMYDDDTTLFTTVNCFDNCLAIEVKLRLLRWTFSYATGKKSRTLPVRFIVMMMLASSRQDGKCLRI